MWQKKIEALEKDVLKTSKINEKKKELFKELYFPMYLLISQKLKNFLM